MAPPVPGPGERIAAQLRSGLDLALIDVDLARCDELDCDFHEALSWTAQQQNSGPTSATSNEC